MSTKPQGLLYGPIGPLSSSSSSTSRRSPRASMHNGCQCSVCLRQVLHAAVLRQQSIHTTEGVHCRAALCRHKLLMDHGSGRGCGCGGWGGWLVQCRGFVSYAWELFCPSLECAWGSQSRSSSSEGAWRASGCARVCSAVSHVSKWGFLYSPEWRSMQACRPDIGLLPCLPIGERCQATLA